MNILVLTRSTHYHFKSGGLESQLKNLLEGLSSRGVRLWVITTALPILSDVKVEDKNSYYEFVDYNITYIFIKDTTPGLYPLSLYESMFKKSGYYSRGTSEGSKNYFVETNKIVKDILKREKIDIVLSQSTSARKLIKVKTPIISIIHGTIDTEIKNRFKTLKTFKNLVRFIVLDIPNWYIEKVTSNFFFFRRCAYMVAVSQILRNAFIREYPMFKDKTKVIYNGVDQKVFIPSKEKFDAFTILYIGRLEREKGVDLIIRALKLLVDKELNVQLLIIGDGIHKKEFQDLTTSLNIDRYVKFLGSMKNTELPEFYGKSHVFVFPSRREEGHPVTVSESYCSGLPIIASKKGGLKELIENGRTGYYLEQENEAEIAGIVESLYRNKDLLKKMSSNARFLGENKFSKNIMVSKYLDLFKLAMKVY